MARGKKSKRRAAATGEAPTEGEEKTAAEGEAAASGEAVAAPVAAPASKPTAPGETPARDVRETERRQKKILALVGGLALLGVIVAVVLFAQGGGDSNTDLSTKPTVDVPSGPPPKDVQTKDIVTGDGATAEPGDQVSVQYVGVTYKDGKQFDASWDRGQPFNFQLGAGNVIPGWDKGIVGMKVGGRRELIIPAKDAYGKQGSPPQIGPNEALVFIVDLLDVQPPSAAGGAAGAVPPTGG